LPAIGFYVIPLPQPESNNGKDDCYPGLTIHATYEDLTLPERDRIHFPPKGGSALVAASRVKCRALRRAAAKLRGNIASNSVRSGSRTLLHTKRAAVEITSSGKRESKKSTRRL
jgi:hypothetical protein